MFHRCTSVLLLALSLGASFNVGACNLKQSAPGVVTLTVDSASCLRKTQDLTKMALALKAAVASMPSGAAGTRGADKGDTVSRTPAQQKLYNIADMVDQGRYLSGKPHFDGYYAYPSARR